MINLGTTFIRHGPPERTACRMRVRRSSQFCIVRTKEIPEITSLQKSRAATILVLNDLCKAILELAEIFHRETGGGPDYEHGADDLPEDESDARRPRVDAKLEFWKAAAADLENELSAELSKIWRRVRQLERIAIGPDASGGVISNNLERAAGDAV
jgi:hypothetical protein